MPEVEFSITGFGTAQHSLSSTQRKTIRGIAERLVSGDDEVPSLSAARMIEIVGHAIGTKNLEMHANMRAESVLTELNGNLRALGASDSEIAKIQLGEPVTKLSNERVQVGDRKVLIAVHPRDTTPSEVRIAAALSDYLTPEPPTGWQKLGHTGAPHKLGKVDVWVGPERLWKAEMKAASIAERWSANYAGIAHVISAQDEPSTVDRKIKWEHPDFPNVERRLRLREIEELLMAVYTTGEKLEWGSGPMLRQAIHAMAPVIEQHQGLAIVRISKEFDREETRGVFSETQLAPVAQGAALGLVRKAMVKNALFTAQQCLALFNRGYSETLAGDTARNCGIVISFVSREHSEALQLEKKIREQILDALLLPLNVPSSAVGPLGPSGAKIATGALKAILKETTSELITAANTMELSEIKTEFRRQANRIQEQNPMLSDSAKKRITGLFEDGMDTALQF
jgi:hypothetical protein